jgi:hypothetical protein
LCSTIGSTSVAVFLGAFFLLFGLEFAFLLLSFVSAHYISRANKYKQPYSLWLELSYYCIQQVNTNGTVCLKRMGAVTDTVNIHHIHPFKTPNFNHGDECSMLFMRMFSQGLSTPCCVHSGYMAGPYWLYSHWSNDHLSYKVAMQKCLGAKALSS